jgi:DNA primase
MPKSLFVDFKAVKAAVTMEQVLDRYGFLDKFKKSGDSLSGPCPIHRGSNPTQFRVSISKNIWNCFSKCQHGGNVLDFIAKMEDVNIHAAALKAIEWFGLDPDAMQTSRDQDESPSEEKEKGESQKTHKPKSAPPKPEAKEDSSAPNKSLKFRLDKLVRDHPYLTERGLTLETVIDFGVGYCEKGMMAERIAIPIRNALGEVLAYAGRFPGEPAADVPKYKLPPGFRKSLELFNIDRAIKEPAENPLVIVEGFFDCMKLHQQGFRKVVALMGSTMSAAQEELIRKHTNDGSHVIVMLDEDDAGRTGRDDIACRLAKFCFIKTHVFDEPNMQPEQLLPENLRAILEDVP